MASEGHWAPDPGATDLEAVLHALAARKLWRRGVEGATLVVLIALLVLLWRGAFVPRPAPTFTLRFLANISWGRVIIDGMSLSLQAGQSGTIALSDAHSVVVRLDAPPFAPKTCQIDPLARTGDCQILEATSNHLTIGLTLSLSDLPSALHGQVHELIAHALDFTRPQTAIPIGGSYTRLQGIFTSPEIASTPLLATLQTQLASDGFLCGDTCLLDLPVDASGSAADLWALRVPVEQQWRFTRADNGTVMSDAPETIQPMPIDLRLIYQSATGIFLLPPPAVLLASVQSRLCSDGFSNALPLFYQGAAPNYALHPQISDLGVRGCLLRFISARISPAVQDDALFLWRVGTLFAANAPAQTLAPLFPAASALDLQAFTM